MGKIAADGSILKATPGIEISMDIERGFIYGVSFDDEVGYKVKLPDRLVCDKNYIVQLTPENYGEDGPDYTITTIALRNQTVQGFEVFIWADRVQTIASGNTVVPVKSPWHFVIYDI